MENEVPFGPSPQKAPGYKRYGYTHKSPVSSAERYWSVAGAVNKIHHRSLPFTTVLYKLATAEAAPYTLDHR